MAFRSSMGDMKSTKPSCLENETGNISVLNKNIYEICDISCHLLEKDEPQI